MTPGGEPPRLLFGNLDGEDELAWLTRTRRTARPPEDRLDRGRDRRCGAGRLSWTRRALATAAGAATLLRAFARPGDRLWTPSPVTADRLATVPGLPRPELAVGPVGELRPMDRLFAWCETPTVQALRAPHAAAQGGGDAAPVPCDLPLHDLLWRLPRALPAIVAAVHHRAFCLAVQTELGCALAGARMVDSLGALEAHLAGGGAGGGGSWVVKAPFSAAGRSRAVHRHALDPAGLARPELRRRVERLLERHGPLLFEPWMERTADFGAAGLLLPRGVHWVGFHRQIVDARGQFAGIELEVDGAGIGGVAGLSREQRERWQRVLAAVAGALGRAGYVGPFGIDSWQYRGPDGAIRLQALGEINARVTFGLVARALVARLREPLGLAAGDRIRLAFGRQPAGGPGSGIEVAPLLLPGDARGSGAWLEIRRQVAACKKPGA